MNTIGGNQQNVWDVLFGFFRKLRIYSGKETENT